MMQRKYTLWLKHLKYSKIHILPKFDSSVDVDIRLGIDPKKSDQMVRGVVSLPHGLGKVVRVLVLCSPDKEQEAKDAGAEHVGLDTIISRR